MLAAMVLGADAVQIGSRFVASDEASCHENFKRLVIEAREGATELSLKKLTPVRLLKNEFYKQVINLEENFGTREAFEVLLGKGRAKLGMYEGDIVEGELEIGQVCALIDKKLPAKTIIDEIWQHYNSLL